jgi:hypothetical protein
VALFKRKQKDEKPVESSKEHFGEAYGILVG